MTPAIDASPLMATYPPPPVTFVHGDGSYLFDDTGRRYLDLLSGLCDRILVLADGRPTALIDAAGTTEADLLAHALPHEEAAAP